jgi:hypothetical protein
MIKHFLLVYDHAVGKLVDVVEFGKDSNAALKRYEELEAEHRDEPKMDIVLVGSDSLDTIKITHRNYFDEALSMADLEKFLRGIPGQVGGKH